MVNKEKSKIMQALEFLADNHGKKVTTAARIYKCEANSVRVALKRQQKRDALPSIAPWHSQHGGHNQILTKEQEEALINYINIQYKEGLGASKQMIFAAVICLWRQQGHTDERSWRWL